MKQGLRFKFGVKSQDRLEKIQDELDTYKGTIIGEDIDARDWMAHIPLDPEEFCEMLMKDIPGCFRLYIDPTEPDVEYSIEVLDGRHRLILYDERSFSSSRVKAGDLDVQTTHKGYGRTYLRNVMQMMSLSDVGRFEIEAGQSHGGFLWAEAGFKNVDVKKVPVLLKRLAALEELIGNNLFSDEFQSIQRAFQNTKNDHFYHQLTKFDFDILPYIETARSQQLVALDGYDGLELEQIHSDCLKRSGERAGELPFHRALLYSMHWDGYAELQDPSHMALLDKFFQWNLIEINDDRTAGLDLEAAVYGVAS